MKKRNPIFVAGFPYILFFTSYILLQFLTFDAKTKDGSSEWPVTNTVLLLIILVMFAIGGIYSLYWQISTARALRKATGKDIPHAILLFIPFANYWWQWRYSEAAEAYTKEKVQAILGFILLAVTGSIGNGILQDHQPTHYHQHFKSARACPPKDCTLL
jgi:hypothetical protein